MDIQSVPTHLQSEFELLASARAGDRSALAELLRRHRPRLQAICRRMCRDNEEASEVLQDTMLGISANIQRFRGDSSLLTWAYTIARTHRARRRRGRSVEAKAAHLRVELDDGLEEASGPDHSPYDRVVDDELRKALRGAIEALSTVDREVLLRRDLEGFSAAEVAAQLGLSVPAVKTRLHRARVATRERMRDAAL
ncbi:MAG: RNA polymerase sigma factor [Myxococcales bacterium]|nr:RNA polymerase sigma factor [Myxococcales bacterium]